MPQNLDPKMALLSRANRRATGAAAGGDRREGERGTSLVAHACLDVVVIFAPRPNFKCILFLFSVFLHDCPKRYTVIRTKVVLKHCAMMTGPSVGSGKGVRDEESQCQPGADSLVHFWRRQALLPPSPTLRPDDVLYSSRYRKEEEEAHEKVLSG